MKFLITYIPYFTRLGVIPNLEKNNSFSFLDVRICREKDKFTTSVFRKDTFSGVYTKLSRFVALKHKFGLVHKILHRIFTILSDFSRFHFEVETLQRTLSKIAYSIKLLKNVYQYLLIIYLFKNLLLPPFENWNLE